VQEIVAEKRRDHAEALKEQGNVEYRAGHFKRAAELYTSAILECDEDQVSTCFGYSKVTNYKKLVTLKNFIKIQKKIILPHY
jgi:hypothetical protein